MKFSHFLISVSIFLFLYCVKISSGVEDDRKETAYWREIGSQQLKQSQSLLGEDVRNKLYKAKNVILFLGDGMGMPTISAARLLKKQLENNKKITNLEFEKFNFTALIKTYNLDYPVPDSAGTGTAFCTGVKTNRGLLGVNGNINFGNQNCTLIQANTIQTIYEKAAEKGKRIGVVTTASVTDATPAATYSHVSSRNFESFAPFDSKSECKDIARQLIEDHNYNVVLGGGRKNFAPKSASTPDGERKDGINLFDKWLELKKNLTNNNTEQYKLIENRQELLKLLKNENDQLSKIDYLFGTFSKNHMLFDAQRNCTNSEDTNSNCEPSLEEMTEIAIKILQNNDKDNDNGFILMVEGAKIDKAHHSNQAYYSLMDVLAFEKSIKKALNLLNLQETLIIVTADHSHSFTHNGGSLEMDNIFEFSQFLASDRINFTPLLYSNGPGYQKDRKNLTEKEVTAKDYRQQSAIPLSSATHGGDDVGAYAIGPCSNLLHGSQEQVIIAHLMEFASCIGDYQNEQHCSKTSGSINKNSLNFSLIILIIIFGIFIKNYF